MLRPDAVTGADPGASGRTCGRSSDSPFGSRAGRRRTSSSRTMSTGRRERRSGEPTTARYQDGVREVVGPEGPRYVSDGGSGGPEGGREPGVEHGPDSLVGS